MSKSVQLSALVLLMPATMACAALDVTREILIGLLGQPDPTTWYVAEGGNDAVPCYLRNFPCATVRGAHAFAEDGDTIFVLPGVHVVGNAFIEKNVTIEGESAAASVLDGDGDGPVLRFGTLEGDEVLATVRNLTIQGGHRDGNMGGIGVLAGAEVVMTDMIIRDNSSGVFAGGIHNEGLVRAERLTIQGNAYLGDVRGCGGIENEGTLQLIAGRVMENEGLFRGGICNSEEATMTLSDSRISGNLGGGIVNHGSLIILGGEIVENQFDAGDSGGDGILNFGSLTIRAGTLIESNLADGVYNSSEGIADLAQARLVGNNGHGLVNYGTANLSRMTIENNRNFDPRHVSGGGIANGFLDEDARLTVVDSTIENNADPVGLAGGVFIGSGTARLERVTIRSNNATGLHNAHGTVRVIDSEITDQAEDYGILNSAMLELIGSVVSNSRGGINNREDANLLIQDSTIESNARPCTSALLNFGDARMIGSTVSGNRSTSRTSLGCSAIVNSRYFRESTLQLENSTLSGNRGTRAGGGLRNETTLGLSSVTVIDNTPGGVINDASSGLRLEQSLLVDNGVNCVGPGFISMGFNLDNDGTCLLVRASDLPAVAGPISYLPLADNGGPTLTHALESSSPAVDAAGTACPAADQRGFGRPADGDGDGSEACDIGAFELGGVMPLSGAATAPPALLPTPDIGGLPTATFLSSTNCRRGPGTIYAIVLSYLAGDQIELDGKNGDGSWLHGEDNCWVSAVTVEVAGIVAELPALPIPPTPTFTPPPATATPAGPPAAPSNLAISEICSQTEYTITLNWQDNADNEDGFRVYYNGNLIATLGPNATNYEYAVPSDFSAMYAVEAFNEAGSSNQVTVNEDGCLV